MARHLSSGVCLAALPPSLRGVLYKRTIERTRHNNRHPTSPLTLQIFGVHPHRYYSEVRWLYLMSQRGNGRVACSRILPQAGKCATNPWPFRDKMYSTCTLSEAGADPILFSWPVANLFIASKLIRKLAHHFNEKLPILKQKI